MAEDLSLPVRLAFNYAPATSRAVFASFFALNARLEHAVTTVREPLAAQLRLAWWRDELRKPADQRSQGEPVLASLGAEWNGEDQALVRLVDGWEQLLDREQLSAAAAAEFLAGLGEGGAALARLTGERGSEQAAHEAAQLWARHRLFALAGHADDRPATVPRLPPALRPLAVLAGLSRRALAGKRRELVAGRRDLLAVMRLGMFGQ